MIGFVVSSLLATSVAVGQQALPPATAIESIQFERNGAELTAILTADGTMQQRVYQQDDTRQLIVEVPGVRNPLRHHYADPSDPLVERILMYEFPPSPDRPRPVARVVFELKSPVTHRMQAFTNELHITLIPRGGETPEPSSIDSDALPNEVQRSTPQADVGSSTSTTNATPSPTSATSTGPASASSNVRVPDRVEIQPPDVEPALFFSPESAGLDDYRVGPEDVLEVRVFEVDELNRTLRVSGNGQIDLPLIGSLKVMSLTPNEVAEAISERLRDRFVQNPQVSVFVQEFNSSRVSLLGSVGRPATYPLLGRKNLLQLLADAGGLDGTAGSLLYVFRQAPDGRSARLSVPLTELMIHGNPLWNIWLRPGDAISVPPEAALSVSIFGAVEQPGVHKLPVGEGATLLKAIALAGGLNERASKRGIQIKRLDPETGEETVFKVNLGDILSGKRPDVQLFEGDVLVVNESFF